MVNITINGKNIKASEDQTILQVCKENGIDVPALCNDDNLKPFSACRICVVEIEGNPKLQTSCSLPVQEGMVIHTESEKVIKYRKELLQLLLDNHPNDCLTCEKAGNCLLQEYSYRYDVQFREHEGDRRESIIDTSSPYILKDESKCILCGKCVRTCAQVNDRGVLSFANRGFETKIVADADNTFEDSKCVSCNRCVAICPTGALIDKRNMKKARYWEVEKEIVKCNVCEYGCDFIVIKKNNKNIAVKADSPGEGRPLCLKGRLWTELQYVDDVQDAYLKKDGKFVKVDWKEALGFERILNKINNINEK